MSALPLLILKLSNSLTFLLWWACISQ